jgi:hypothetical protein
VTYKQSRLFKFLYEIRWVAVSLVLVCAVWFENENLVKNNTQQIKEMNTTIKLIDQELNTEVRSIDDRIDDNSSDIKILKDKIKNKL